MRINQFRALIVFFYILLFSTVSFPQTVGKIFSRVEADSLFGNVIESVPIERCNLISLFNKTQNYIMFQVINGELVILGDGRKVLYPEGKNVSSDEVFALFSKSKVAELLGLSCGNTVTVEKRNNYLTVTFELLTLEEMEWCPPFCY